MSIVPRLNRLFGPDGKCFEVAMDHGVHNEPGFLSGIENFGQALRRIASCGPDAILLTPGHGQFLQDLPGRQKPSLTLRADPTNFYATPTPSHVFCQMLDEVIHKAVTLDAVSVVVNLLWAPDQQDLYHQCLKNVTRAKAQCEQYGMPLMVEPLPATRKGQGGPYSPDPDIARIASLVRQSVELGADIVKAEVSDHLEDYHRVIEAASGKPVLPRGGSKVSDKEVLSRTYALMKSGASGVVYGRNVFQHSHPEKMIKACMSIIHDGASPETAQALLSS